MKGSVSDSGIRSSDQQLLANRLQMSSFEELGQATTL